MQVRDKYRDGHAQPYGHVSSRKQKRAVSCGHCLFFVHCRSTLFGIETGGGQECCTRKVKPLRREIKVDVYIAIVWARNCTKQEMRPGVHRKDVLDRHYKHRRS